MPQPRRLAHVHCTRSRSSQRRKGAPFGPGCEAWGQAQLFSSPQPTLPGVRSARGRGEQGIGQLPRARLSPWRLLHPGWVNLWNSMPEVSSELYSCFSAWVCSGCQPQRTVLGMSLRKVTTLGSNLASETDLKELKLHTVYAVISETIKPLQGFYILWNHSVYAVISEAMKLLVRRHSSSLSPSLSCCRSSCKLSQGCSRR